MVKHQKELIKFLTCSRICDYRVYASDTPWMMEYHGPIITLPPMNI